MNTPRLQEGDVLDEGEAKQVSPEWWEYSSTVEGRIEAIAWDLADNQTKEILIIDT